MDLPTGALGLSSRMAASAHAADVAARMSALWRDNSRYARCPDVCRPRPIRQVTSLQDQLRVPAGALGDFFGPGTTVGIPFAAQLGVRMRF